MIALYSTYRSVNITIALPHCRMGSHAKFPFTVDDNVTAQCCENVDACSIKPKRTNTQT